MKYSTVAIWNLAFFIANTVLAGVNYHDRFYRMAVLASFLAGVNIATFVIMLLTARQK